MYVYMCICSRNVTTRYRQAAYVYMYGHMYTYKRQLVKGRLTGRDMSAHARMHTYIHT
jgi:hypothetical protein